jgi:hypothetical protein
LTDEQRRELVCLYTTPAEDGTWTGVYAIARHFGISSTAVQYWLNRMGVPQRTSQEAFAHAKRTKPIKNVPPDGEPAPLCRCGCGESVAWNRRKNHWNVYAVGHYRQDAPYKHREWLIDQYVTQNRTIVDMAADCGVDVTQITRFMDRFGIDRRNKSEARIGRQAGAKNPAWKGGTTPERQRLYKTQAWKDVIKAVYERDGYQCQRCGETKARPKGRHAHHIRPWADDVSLRFELSNLVTLCERCHIWVHSRENVNRDFLV